MTGGKEDVPGLNPDMRVQTPAGCIRAGDMDLEDQHYLAVLIEAAKRRFARELELQQQRGERDLP
jgi:hypothetical protein